MSSFTDDLTTTSSSAAPDFELQDGSRVAVIGGGPAGSFFAYFFLDMAERIGLDVTVDIYEPRDFSARGPIGCNKCGGIISESLVQALAADGINLPPTVVQRGIEAYVLHMDVGDVRIDTPLQEKRIAAVYRGSGPRKAEASQWGSFDNFMLTLAQEKGARVIRDMVSALDFESGRPQVTGRKGETSSYDLLVVASGINSTTHRLFKDLGLPYKPPETTQTYICEYAFDPETMRTSLGDSMHVFLLNIPRLEFAAVIPKGVSASVCLLGDDLDKELRENFLAAPEVRSCMPGQWSAEDDACRCAPLISTQGAETPYGDRIVFIGDAGVTRLYKDGIGAAYRTAKAAASAAVFHGVSRASFEQHFWPVCRRLLRDNRLGKIVFQVTRMIQYRRFARQALLSMVRKEQQSATRTRHMSTVLWDMFTGSAPYAEVFMRTLHPGFLWGFSTALIKSLFPWRSQQPASAQAAPADDRSTV